MDRRNMGGDLGIRGSRAIVEELTPVPEVSDALRVFAHLPAVLLFESSATREDVGRYSFLTADPVEVVRIDNVSHGDSPFDRSREISASHRAETIPGLPPFQGGIAGLLSYELGHAWEDWPRARHDEFQLPDMVAGLYDWVIAWDNYAGQAWVIVQSFGGSVAATKRLRWIQESLATDAAEGTLVLSDKSCIRPPITNHFLTPSPPHRLAPQFQFSTLPGVTSDFSRDGYLRAVERVIEYIHAGDIFQANLSQRLLIPQRGSPVDLYRRLREENPAPFAGYFAVDDWAIVSASPERFLRVAGDDVETRPIKGTRKRQTGPEADLYTRDELRESEKDRAENVMIVDLLRNDLSRVCRPGSIRVEKLCNVESFETVQHLVSEVRGTLEPPRTVWDLFEAAFPGGSITGAPKVRAMEIISEIEPTARGPYCGSLFYVGLDGSVDSSILIRTFLCRGGWIQCPVGGGIVAQSDPVAEYEETLHKAAGMLRAV